MSVSDNKCCEIPHILVVDDDPDLLESLKETLEVCDTEYHISTAKNLTEALDITKASSPDLAVIDIKIGNEDGLQLIPQLKVIQHDIICIMMTAFREAEYAVSAVKKGADDYLFKPINPDHLFETLENHLLEQKKSRGISISQNRVKQVFEKVNHLLFVVDLEGNTLEANEMALRVPKTSDSYIIGEKFWSLPWWSTHESNQQLIREKFQSVIEGNTVNFEISDKNHINSLRHYAISMKPAMDADGSVTMVIPEVQDITEQKNNQVEIEALAFYDPLTGLANRRMFGKSVEKTLSNSQHHSMQSALLFIDLDYFKEINDQLGHHEGDKLLKQVSSRLLASIRQEDLAARLGGDEFVVLLSMLDSDPQAAALKAEVVAEKVRQSLCMPYPLPKQAPQVSASIGIVLFPFTGTTLQDLINAADTAMYQAKQSGRNQIALYDRRFEEVKHGHRIIEADILKGIEQSQFQLYFQAIYNSQGQISALETLPRWHHPEYGLILPDEFIPLAEQYGMMEKLCQWTLKKACETLAQHPKLSCKLAINISSQNFYHKQFANRLLKICQNNQFDCKRLIIEISEQLLEQNPEQAVELINQLNLYGVQFSLDDFTMTGNTLHHLSQLPIAQVKLSSQLVTLEHERLVHQRLLEGIVAMGNTMSFGIMAKNIESDLQYKHLQKLRLDGFQGYYLKKPMPLEELL